MMASPAAQRHCSSWGGAGLCQRWAFTLCTIQIALCTAPRDTIEWAPALKRDREWRSAPVGRRVPRPGLATGSRTAGA